MNMPPDELVNGASTLLEKANAYVFATERPTNYPTNAAARTLDYVITSDVVCPWIQSVKVNDGLEVRPHRAVSIIVKASMHNYLINSIKSPAKFPKDKPIGCARAPVVPQWCGSDLDRRCSGQEGGDPSPYVPVEDGWPALVHAVEAELCHLTDNVDKTGRPHHRFVGRSSGVSTAQRLAMPMRASASLGKVNLRAHALMWFANRVLELANIAQRYCDTHQIPRATWLQWAGIMNSLRTRSGLTGEVAAVDEFWQATVGAVRATDFGHGSGFLHYVASQAQLRAKQEKESVATQRASSWKAFVQSQLHNGAAAAHRLTKKDGAPPVEIATTISSGRRTASPQAIVNEDLSEWATVWRRLQNQTTDPWRSETIDGNKLPPIDASAVRAAARSFKTTTSVGCDAIAPRAFAWLSEPLLAAVAVFLNSVEESGTWPSMVATALVHLIPKPGGGRRPIGILPTIVRIWERCRKAEVQRWMRQNRRSFDWATQGRSAETAAWHQSIMDEAATSQGLTSVGAFLDLAKAFENVPLQDIWAAGRRLKFPLVILRATLESFAFARRLVYQQAISELVATLSAILAGGGFAQMALHLVLVEPLEAVYSIPLAPSVTLTVCEYVDDIAVHANGHTQDAVRALTQTTEQLIDHLEGHLCMVVSRRKEWASTGKGKTVAAASTALAARLLSTPMRRLGIQLRRKAKHLGIDFAPGARTRQRLRHSRWVNNVKRASRTARLGRRLGRHVFRTGLAPAVTYGSVVAMPKRGTLLQMRRAAARVIGPIKGRSMAARLAVNKVDPAWTVISRTVMQWAGSIWDATMCPQLLQHAWRYALRRAIETGKPSVSAGGAAGAMIDAISQVEWHMPSYNSVKTIEGTILMLDQVPPRTIIRFLWDDYAIVSASKSLIAAQVTQQAEARPVGHSFSLDALKDKFMVHHGKLVPWFEPIAQALNAGWARRQTPAAISSAAALAEGGWWPQARLFEHGLVADPVCRACGNQPGTLLHRMSSCSARSDLIENKCPAWLAQQALQRPHDPLFTDGVPLRPKQPAPPPAFEDWVGAAPADGALAYGEAYTDGALKGTIPRARRAGWAFVVKQGSTVMWGKYGVCDEPYATVLRAELRALLEILRNSVGGITVHVDNAQVVDGVQLGKQWCTSSRREGADLWRSIWALLEELPSVRIVKVKAHLTFAHVVQGTIQFDHWRGNGAADLCAKKGCEIACVSAESSWMQASWRRAKEWYRWAVAVAAEWIEDTAPSGPVQARDAPARAESEDSPPTAPRGTAKHELWANRDTTWCRLCGATGKTATGNKQAAAFRKPCRGSLTLRSRVSSRTSSMDPLTYDNGNVPLAFLHERLAVKIYAPQLEFEGGVPRPPLPPEVEVHASPGLEERPPSIASESEEDPFGHLQAGLGDSPAVVSSNAGMAAGTPCIPPVVDPGVSEESAAGDGIALQHVTGDAGPIHASHSLRTTAGAVWCSHCGRSAITRIGVGLLRPCRGFADGAYPARMERLRAGRHPVSGRPLRAEDVLATLD